ncbi:MAG: NAD kinase [Pigmentiphaga sp.]
MHFPIVALIGKYHDAGIAAPLLELADMLRAAGREVLFETDTAHHTQVTHYPTATLDQIGEHASLAIVMGGDGTMLAVARHLASYNVPLAGINHGRVGFITDIQLPHALEAVSLLLQGHYESEERMLLAASVRRGEDILFATSALNDVVLNRASRGGMIDMQISVDGESMASMRADGLVIATPTGSTAYALSAHGPILHPSLNGIVLVPVAPQTLSNRPIVLPDSCTLEVTLNHIGRVETGASVHFDMQTWSQIAEGDRIVVRRNPHTIRFLHPPGYSYFDTLRQKLLWNLMPAEASGKSPSHRS